MKPWILFAPVLVAIALSLRAIAPLAGPNSSSVPPAGAAGAQPALAPGEVIRLTFPDLPPTLFAMVRGQKQPEPAVSIRLPDNYSADRTFPLLVWLGINDGGVGAEIGQPMRIAGRSDYIVANFPIFRRSHDPTVSWGIAPGADDYPVMAPAYAAIMQRIRATIPNIDPSASIIGGFSNGGHTLAVLLSALDETILKNFHGYFFIDSGFDWTSYKRNAILGERHILYLVGAGAPGETDWWRPDVVERVRFFERAAKHMGVPAGNWRFEVFPGVGHEFPDEYVAIIRKWAVDIRGKNNAE
ncbi:MAG: hypothetical protein L0Y44_16395 [Phycisphaerales bacterium]|nr:hypothetical protein [Phycisphaerales bacterium]